MIEQKPFIVYTSRELLPDAIETFNSHAGALRRAQENSIKFMIGYSSVWKNTKTKGEVKVAAFQNGCRLPD